mgnify:FL=1
MLELNKYSTNKIEDLKDFFTVAFVIIDDIYNEIAPTYIRKRRNIKDAILCDSEIITIRIVGELLMIDSEKSWLTFVKRNFKDLFPRMYDRTRFNRTRQNLHAIIEAIRKYMTSILGYQAQPIRVIDSIPIPICKFDRAHFHRTFKVDAEYGYCASKKETYYGFKLHAITTLDGFITDFVLTPDIT